MSHPIKTFIPKIKLDEIQIPKGYESEISINRETANELLLVLNHQFVSPEYKLVHDLIKRCWELTGNK